MRKPLAEEDCELQFCETIYLSVCQGREVFLICKVKKSPADYMAAKADDNKEVTDHG